jgi:hypothetical protein
MQFSSVALELLRRPLVTSERKVESAFIIDSIPEV